MTRYVFITGGVASSLGKGLVTASLGALLQSYGYTVRLKKLDPYLNVDPGTMSPFQHGEVFVTDDGSETDLDLGHYERFTGVSADSTDSITSGKIYSRVIEKERRGDYLGATVQVVPHIIDEIKESIQTIPNKVDFVLCEIGGTVGDIESLPFIEAMRQMRMDHGTANTLFIHLGYIPYLKAAGELKTKPTQHSVKDLLSLGVQPDFLVCRSEYSLDDAIRSKLAMFCNIKMDHVFQSLDLQTIYEAPLHLEEQSFGKRVLNYFNLDGNIDLSTWSSMVHTLKNPLDSLTIGVIGKYMGLNDAYKSLREALIHAGIPNKLKINIHWIDSTDDDLDAILPTLDGILVPGGFGHRGVDGKIKAIRYARENKIPFFGICLGLQLSIIEAARNLCGIDNATSTEFDPDTSSPVICQIKEGNVMGGTMRLGNQPCTLSHNTHIHSIYKSDVIHERHRHRYGVNPVYYDELIQKAGLTFCGHLDHDGHVETLEYKNHPWFIAVQFHPELKSRPFEPHPLFLDFIRLSYQHNKFKNERSAA
jgi:CTP synthase